MDSRLVHGFRGLVQVLARGQSARTSWKFLLVLVGWVLTTGDHAVTAALVQTGAAGLLHHEAFHRVFSRARWSMDDLGRRLLLLIVDRLPDEDPVALVLDDTVAGKKGPHVFGLATHVDAVRSTRKHRAFCFGHCWVMLAVVVRVPFSSRPWALPLLFRLYRPERLCRKSGEPYRKKTELGREMLHLVASWLPERRIEASMDSGYANATVAAGLPEHVVLVGRMRPDAVLTDPRVPKAVRGRARKYGDRLPTPAQLAKDESLPWQSRRMRLYGREASVRYKSFTAVWKVLGPRLLRIVVVDVPTGKVDVQVFFSTDPELSGAEVLPRYARRWSIEVAFRDLKQHLGFADSSARRRQAVLRTAPSIGLTMSLLVLWFADGAMDHAVVPSRPWYRHKRDLSFEDILRTARAVLPPLAAKALSSCREANLRAAGYLTTQQAPERAPPAA